MDNIYLVLLVLFAVIGWVLALLFSLAVLRLKQIVIDAQNAAQNSMLLVQKYQERDQERMKEQLAEMISMLPPQDLQN